MSVLGNDRPAAIPRLDSQLEHDVYKLERAVSYAAETDHEILDLVGHVVRARNQRTIWHSALAIA